jgi:protein ImuB
MYACLHAPGNLPLLFDCACVFSPHIEEISPDTIIFDARGLASLYGPSPQLAREIERRVGIPANIAIAANPDAAIHAATGIPGITTIQPGREAEALARLPINLLGGSPARRPPTGGPLRAVSKETAELLDLWGIRTFGDFAKLPPLGVAARLGDEGVYLQTLARGEGRRQLRPLEDPLQFEEAMELEYPVDLLEPLAFVLARLLNEVCRRLGARSLATNEIRLRLTLEKAALENAPEHFTILRLPVPMLDPAAFLKMLQLKPSGRPPAAPVLKAALTAEPVKPRRTQQGLFTAMSPELEKLELTIARIRHLTGPDKVGAPQLVDTHRPDSYVMRAFSPGAQTHTINRPVARLCLRRFRPPKYAQVILSHDRPARITSPVVNGAVVTAKGPWKTSGDWWREDAWHRDEWDIETTAGGLYRLYKEIHSSRWFVEGSYD